MQRWFSLIVLIIISLSWPAAAGTLERVRDTGEFKLGYREDAVPFSYKNELGEVTGYSVDLCRFVAVQVKKQLELDDMEVTYVPVTAENRFNMIQGGEIDILCGPTSVTLSRREMVDFSLFTFVDGASVLYLAEGPKSFEGHCQTKNLAIFQSPSGCWKSQVFCAVHRKPGITNST